MKILAGVLATVFGIGVIGEKRSDKTLVYTVCFCVSIAIMYFA